MTRRQFIQIIASVGIVCAAGVRWLAAKTDVPYFLGALKARTFPGRVRPLDDDEIRKEGKWQG
jgi:hypothetical protein